MGAAITCMLICGSPILNPPDVPAFSEPWQATAFAMAVKLHESGAFTWSEWAKVLGAKIEKHPDCTYYECWLVAIEHLVEAKNIIGAAERAGRIDAWDKAARATPHGQPIELKHSIP
jgi:nitrile hydratase accessory protein